MRPNFCDFTSLSKKTKPLDRLHRTKKPGHKAPYIYNNLKTLLTGSFLPLPLTPFFNRQIFSIAGFQPSHAFIQSSVKLSQLKTHVTVYQKQLFPCKVSPAHKGIIK